MTGLVRLLKSLPEPVKKPLRLLWGFWYRVTRLPLEFYPDAPDLFLVYRDLLARPQLERRPGGWFYKGKFYPDYLTVGGAGYLIFPVASRYCRGYGVDVGAGFWPLPGATPVDTQRGPGARKALSEFRDGSLDYVFSSHCLEHIEDWQGELREWIRKIRCGGFVFLYLPHPECAIWHPGSPFVGDGHKWVPTPEVIKEALARLGCEVISCDDGPDAMQSFYVCGGKRVELHGERS